MQIEEVLIIFTPLVIGIITLIVTLANKPRPFKIIRLAKTNTFEFRSERPVNKNGELLFGHDEIVDTLDKIVDKTNKTFTIGIYGDWGSGKSSIAESLQTQLIDKEIPLVIFDVWKHEGDALRRTFLDKVINTLTKSYGSKYYNTSIKLDDRLKDVQTITKEYYDVIWKKIGLHLGITLLFSFCVLLPFFLIWFFFDFVLDIIDIKTTYGKIANLVLSSSVAPFIYKYFNNFIENKKVVTNKDRFKDPVEFEKEFRRILDKGLRKDKIVIVFDNLDRVSGDKAVEIISTIKTFLEPIDRSVDGKNVIFIIPCDAEAVKRHLKKSLGYEIGSPEYHEYAEEYLRKFFNTIIWIPELYSTELEKFSHDELIKTEIKSFDNFELAGLITLVFGANPRQIIQFINILVANYLLFEERNISGYPANKNVIPLAKYLLLTQKFPDLMLDFRANGYYNLKTGIDLITKTSRYSIDQAYQIRIGQLNDFYLLTDQWEIKSLDVFFKFKLSDFEKVFENSSQLISLLQSNRMTSILKNDKTGGDANLNSETDYMQSLKIDSRGDEFSSLVREKVKLSQSPNILAQFLNGVCELTKEYDKSLLSDEVYKEIQKKLTNDNFASKIEVLDVNNVVTECIEKIQSDELRGKFRDVFTDQWIKDFENKHKKEKVDGTE